MSELLRQVQNATREEKLEIYGALKAFFSLRGEANPLKNLPSSVVASSNDEALYLSAICEELKDRGCDYSSPDMLRKHKHYPTWARDKIHGLDAFFAREQFSRVQKLSILAFGIGAIVANLRHHRIPVTGGNILMNYHKLPALIDRQFPGYSERKLLRWIFREMRT